MAPSLSPSLLLHKSCRAPRGTLCGLPESHQPLAGFPECQGQLVIAGWWPRLLQVTVSEVTSTEALKTLIRGTVQGGPGTLGCVTEEEPGQWDEEWF